MKRFCNIVVPTDFSPFAEAAVARAATLAQLDGATLHLVHAIDVPAVVTPYSIAVPPDLRAAIRRAAMEKLEAVCKEIEPAAGPVVTTELAEFVNAVGAIESAVTKHRADLVVMGTHGRSGLEHAFLGSVAERTLRAVGVPVLAVKEDSETAARPIEKILLAVDFSPHSDRAVEVAADLAQRLAASVEVLHVFDLPRRYNPYLSDPDVEFHKKLEAAASECLESSREHFDGRKVPVTFELRRGDPSTVIAEAASESHCQLIVMGTRGQSGIRHVLLGSTTERTLRAAPCSVLCVKSELADTD